VPQEASVGHVQTISTDVESISSQLVPPQPKAKYANDLKKTVADQTPIKALLKEHKLKFISQNRSSG
jgi:hypothetical protein